MIFIGIFTIFFIYFTFLDDGINYISGSVLVLYTITIIICIIWKSLLLKDIALLRVYEHGIFIPALAWKILRWEDIKSIGYYYHFKNPQRELERRNLCKTIEEKRGTLDKEEYDQLVKTYHDLIFKYSKMYVRIELKRITRGMSAKSIDYGMIQLCYNDLLPDLENAIVKIRKDLWKGELDSRKLNYNSFVINVRSTARVSLRRNANQ